MLACLSQGLLLLRWGDCHEGFLSPTEVHLLEFGSSSESRHNLSMRRWVQAKGWP